MRLRRGDTALTSNVHRDFLGNATYGMGVGMIHLRVRVHSHMCNNNAYTSAMHADTPIFLQG